MQKDLFQPEINVTQEILKIESEFVDGKIKGNSNKKILVSVISNTRYQIFLYELCNQREKKT